MSGLIALAGMPNDKCLTMTQAALNARNVDAFWLDQQAARTNRTPIRRLTASRFQVGDRTIDTNFVHGLYMRLENNVRAAAGANVQSWSVDDEMMNICEGTTGRVLSRRSAGASNFSKPYQLQLIRAAGLRVPETLVTTSKAAAIEFVHQFGRAIYKSTSSNRSIVKQLDISDEERLDRIKRCPVQLQQFIEGTNIRVHVVGVRVFAVSVHSDAIDYRYASHAKVPAPTFRVHELPAPLEHACRELSRACGLKLSGIDLIHATDGRYVGLEVNPMPAFSWYQEQLPDHDIAGAIADLLISPLP
jgi:hypothetical protein